VRTGWLAWKSLQVELRPRCPPLLQFQTLHHHRPRFALVCVKDCLWCACLLAAKALLARAVAVCGAPLPVGNCSTVTCAWTLLGLATCRLVTALSPGATSPKLSHATGANRSSTSVASSGAARSTLRSLGAASSTRQTRRQQASLVSCASGEGPRGPGAARAAGAGARGRRWEGKAAHRASAGARCSRSRCRRHSPCPLRSRLWRWPSAPRRLAGGAAPCFHHPRYGEVALRAKEKRFCSQPAARWEIGWRFFDLNGRIDAFAPSHSILSFIGPLFPGLCISLGKALHAAR
jgi:hypothetical protein